MENFNGSLNGQQQEQTSTAKAIVFAIIGMFIGIIPYLIIGGLLDLRGWWIGAAAVGGAVSFGWHLGKGKAGVARQVTVIILAIIGTFIAIQLGYAIAVYRIGIGTDFIAALEWSFDQTLLGIDIMFENFDSIFESNNIAAMLAWDTLLGMGVAVAVVWKKYSPNSDEDDLEELDNELEDISVSNTSRTGTEMDDVLNQDVPTLNMDQNWDCSQCNATNRSIVDICEYCGGSK